MYIAGLQKTTLLDYPGMLAATIFTRGCNFACPFCQNSELVVANPPVDVKEISQEEILAFLERRKGVLEGVCITGGEPTLQPDLENFICKVRKLGYKIKLDTNGTRPDTLKNLCNEGLLDYVAMDVKAAIKQYPRAAGLSEEYAKPYLEAVQESVAFLMERKVPYEFRTTVVKGLHTVQEMEELARWILGADAYYLQNYKESAFVLAAAGLASFSEDELDLLLQCVRKYVPNAKIRG